MFSRTGMSQTLHDDLTVIDALQYSNWDREVFEELRSGGVTCISATCAIWEDARATLDTIGEWRRRFDEYNDLIMPARAAADIEAAKRLGKTAIILSFQNTSPYEHDLDLVWVFNQLGVKIVQLTYNIQALVGAGCYEPNDSGLTEFGRNVVAEMNKWGVVIDLSHVGERTSLDAIAASVRPVAITHANPLWSYKHPRNKSDAVLAALRENGGVLGLTAYPHIIGDMITLSQFCDMIARTVDQIGIDHVGIGSDTSRKWTDEFLWWIRMGRWTHKRHYGAGTASQPGWAPWPEWFQTPADFPNITTGLAERGFSRDEVAKIMGGNFLRLFKEGFESV
jgi:microsomal dipeptidase-like Zn-dependent dipeptidase